MGTLYPGQDPPPPASTSAQGAGIVGRVGRADGPGPHVMACSTLAGDPVVNREGEGLGTLEHIMIDVRGGKIAYGVLVHGGVLGLGARLYAVPWDALTLDVERRCFVLPVSRARLQEAPGFDRDHWPAMSDPSWARSVHDFYQAPGGEARTLQ
jgi:sporulation protein YlmC with PRC-barrel domain